MVKNIEDIKIKLAIPDDLSRPEKATVEIFKHTAEKKLELAESLIVETWDQQKIADELMRDIQHFEKIVESKRKETKNPIVKLGKAIDLIFSQSLEPTRMAKSIIKDKILAFNEEVERQKKVKEEMDRMKGTVKLIDTTDVLDLVKEDAKVKGIRKTVDFEIVDESLIPREYLKVDEVKIRKEAKEGVEIPGIRLFWKISVQ